ncbi:MarR family winged helix-turn-helix transcriptional regulator [Cohnella herbarum]|uniref:MarR family transcriptional regulator n=1 Tax=Cohnella herbarum TaxID=2728023 RepID=A0A7Z2ZMF0_9BACL|nr:MarR family transcriptional regulator [Cohnella herbarum]QJD84904.1 MarR family transcriptional regulator [Cohnella herbarum]
MDTITQRFHQALQAFKRSSESDILNKMQAQITPPQIFMLYYINKLGGCKLTQLAEKMEVKPSAVTVMIDRLEKSGYVTRSHDTVDRRAILVEATPAGKEVLEKAIQERNEIIGHYLSRLEQEEARILTELLEKMMGIEPQK